MPETKPFAYCDQLVKQFEAVIQKPIPGRSSFYYTGVDLGTACVVLTVLDDSRKPVAGAYRYADVVRDGMVVDYLGAIQIVRELKAQLEQQLGTELEYAASAIPPGTDLLDAGAIKHVIQGAGFEVTALLDEPTAANAVLQISNGAIVDIGGGTTGISILKDGKVVYVADEATGGTHFSLVVAGAYQMSFSEADCFKRDPAHHQELLPLLRPVIDKVSSIINRHVVGHEVKELYLVGGTCCLTGMETIIEQRTGIATYKPSNPLFVTPLGIALNCTREAM
ncbi:MULTISPECIES: ethanolamine utilization protein EutJ [Paenibacillus]|uniref:Chaperone protein DnaK n=1 Tax=Paenibacillus suaedae TaxID=3077233 RepID=A0AAJ2N9E2_9BACL|nr:MULTISPECIES: ethanolamine utilization protein EutJ [Paenibacillus]MDT8977534.1 ethanolamine utilization protein EutJ [Paenibacillus sp. chi10]